MLLPRDPRDDKNVIVEIRAGAGGDEAGIFAGDLLRLYTRYAETNKWKVELLDVNEQGNGVFKNITFEIKGAWRLQSLEVRKRCASRAASTGHRKSGAHPYQHCDGSCLGGNGGG